MPILSSGQLAPSFVLEDVEGEARSLRGETAGGGAVVAFFSLDCRACDLSYLPWDRMWEAYAHLGRPLLAISLDARDAAADFFERSGVSFPVLLDEQREVAQAFGVECTPSLFLIGKEGEILASHDAFDREALNSLSTLIASGIGMDPVLVAQGEAPDFMPGCTIHM